MPGLLRLRLAEDGADPERLDTLAVFLRQELLQLDVADVTPLPAGKAPPGARGWDATTAGGLLVAVGDAAEGLSRIISAVRAWLTRDGRTGRAIRLEIDGDALELSDATAADQDKLIALFIDRHTGSMSGER